jgi:hypothetical protein
MARKPIIKELTNSRLLKDYASWIYCMSCDKTVAYLCYVTYDAFDFEYTCTCGSHGHVRIEFERGEGAKSSLPLIQIKNRLCCPSDNSPLLTIVEKNVDKYCFRVVCNSCDTEYERSIP